MAAERAVIFGGICCNDSAVFEAPNGDVCRHLFSLQPSSCQHHQSQHHQSHRQLRKQQQQQQLPATSKRPLCLVTATPHFQLQTQRLPTQLQQSCRLLSLLRPQKFSSFKLRLPLVGDGPHWPLCRRPCTLARGAYPSHEGGQGQLALVCCFS